jgi:hypothetical protein
VGKPTGRQHGTKAGQPAHLADQPVSPDWKALRTRCAAPAFKPYEEKQMTKILSVIIAAMFAAVSFGALAASHTGAAKDDKKMEKKGDMKKGDMKKGDMKKDDKKK